MLKLDVGQLKECEASAVDGLLHRLPLATLSQRHGVVLTSCEQGGLQLRLGRDHSLSDPLATCREGCPHLLLGSGLGSPNSVLCGVGKGQGACRGLSNAVDELRLARKLTIKVGGVDDQPLLYLF